jgi:SAM-dependent methyltransferase
LKRCRIRHLFFIHSKLENSDLPLYQPCPLCEHLNLERWEFDKDHRLYLYCENCRLVSVEKNFLPEVGTEKNRYQAHQNTLENEGYVRFLEQSIEAALPYLNPGMQGLDYGCGPQPVLAQLLANRGFSCANYDPVFNIQHPYTTYDFIFANECVEHFHRPAKEWKQLHQLLKQEGILTVSTELWTNKASFSTWHYKRDFTHVGFYQWATFEWISHQYGWEIIYTDHKRLIVLRKRN